ncbi:MAG TPA: DUF3098 domain-containing protein [Bacteroidales bacterium]|nr:DUF3098 domain-containing protein [Bacteroidales bacterium]
MVNKNEENMGTPIPHGNLTIIGVAVLLIIIGFFLVSGGGSDDPNVFSEKIFSFRRITIAPIVMLMGYGLVIYGIMRKPKDS